MARRGKNSNDYPVRKDEQGNPLCRWCGVVVKAPRRSWCGQACVDAYLDATDFARQRERVFERDRGICAECGCDTEKVMRVMRRAADSYFAMTTRGTMLEYSFECHAKVICSALHYRTARSYWECDHIVEVVRGGGNELENLQTLCVPCHKLKTKRLHKERAQERRGIHVAPLFDMPEAAA
jgi:5-methylcytosine-specific restriction protein A